MALSCVPSALTVKFEAVIDVSIAPLERMNLSDDAPSRLAPLIVSVTLAPRGTLVGKTLEIDGPRATETNWLKMAGAVPEPNPNRTESIGLSTGTAVLITKPRRTDTSAARAARTPAASPRLTETN